MRIVLQRVSYANVKVDGVCVGKIDRGIVALVGINTDDNEETYKYMLDKLVNLRIFEDSGNKMNLSITELGLGLLLVPNFTVYADARKGRRPSFSMGASPELAEKKYNGFVDYAKAGYANVESGIFKADMKVELLNDGPITILLDSDRLF